jgi:hypothetical protein
VRDSVKSPTFEDGSKWEPFQPAKGITPPFPAFVSGHSTFGGAFESARPLPCTLRFAVTRHGYSSICVQSKLACVWQTCSPAYLTGFGQCLHLHICPVFCLSAMRRRHANGGPIPPRAPRHAARTLMCSLLLHGQVMRKLTGSDKFGLSVTVPAGFLVSEDSDPKADPPRIVPAEDVTLYCAPWPALPPCSPLPCPP